MDSLGFSGPVVEVPSNVFKARNGLFIQNNCMNWHSAIADSPVLSLGDAEAPGQCCTEAVAPTAQGHPTHHPAQAGSSKGLCSHPGVRHMGQGGWENPTSHQQRLAPGGKGKTVPSRVVLLELSVSASALGSQFSLYSALATARWGGDGGPPPDSHRHPQRWYPTSHSRGSQRQRCDSLPLNKVPSVPLHLRAPTLPAQSRQPSLPPRYLAPPPLLGVYVDAV